jgi:hypothetical protein
MEILGSPSSALLGSLGFVKFEEVRFKKVPSALGLGQLTK